MRKFILASALAVLATASAGYAAELTVEQRDITEWKAVFGRIEARDQIDARSRLGGTLVSIDVTEGSDVTEGQVIATIHDPKLALQLEAAQGNIDALRSQLDNARTELTRGENLQERGVITSQQLDSLRTNVSVLENQIAAAVGDKRVIEEQAAEGAVLAPIAGKVLDVPVTRGTVVLPGETIASIGGGGFFLRLGVPERHAPFLHEGMDIRIGTSGEERLGRLAKVYPEIQTGRVIADVEVEGLNSDFVNARVLVSLPIGARKALLVPAVAVETRMGLDFVPVRAASGAVIRRAVVPGQHVTVDGSEMIEILSGISVGDTVVTGDE
ncbi:efflux RND transporter periplasmic adaptor subunit [Pseudodonghicola flavimaris]|uniref:Efflux RND transporter periplasmic adaptor subunit n=1 Tax=Pseudodonghicola flavimaris TaxID=3050036 RepID=A0ABT7EXZ1_9RHOB|nr:efflux RND transporter periplasmic adaptor subunit [Pseudodonghicola flavimaris]MDK3017216.1 efflux RND transporter periplasmic adaptor subunit [Pseudodonghicola flavimaris]